MAIEEEPDAGIPEWVVTFGDMMSLLLTFFIMLVSMSEIKEEERFQAMVESMKEQFGHDASRAALVPGDKVPRNSNMRHVASQGRAKRRDTLRGGDKVRAPVGENPRVQSIRQGKIATVGGVLYFDEFEATLNDENKRRLKQIAREIAGKPQVVEIRGHAMPGPVPEEIGDHWDLSYDRCRAAMEYLTSQGVNGNRFRISAAGRNEPIYYGVDRLEQKKNARVQVIVWDERAIGVSGQP